LGQKISLDKWQEDFINTKGDKILCCGRQVGKSTICAIDAGEWAINNDDKNILIIAPTERQAYALFEKVLNYLLLNYKYKISFGKDKPTQTKITLRNGCKIYCLPTGISGTGIRFMTVGRLYADEASRIREEVWTAVTPMLLTTGGETILLSTANGSRGKFADIATNKDGAYNSFTRFFANSEEVIKNRPICETWTKEQREKAIEQLEREKSRMSRREYAQEYEGRIIDEINQFFPSSLIKSIMCLNKEEKLTVSGDNFLGVDIARMGEDDTVLFSLKRHKEYCYEIGFEITRKTMLTDTIIKIKNLDKIWNYKKIYIDDGGMGVGVFDTLIQDEQTRRKVIGINNAQRSIERREGRVKKLLKEDLYNNLLTMMEQGKIKLYPNDEIMNSLMSVQAEYINGQLRIFGNYTHIAEALIRAAWCVKDKSLNIWIT
jgi:hypothetical protein